MPPQSSRDYLETAIQRLQTAEHLADHKFNLDAQYIGGYAVECALKSLIIEVTNEIDRSEELRRISRSASMHRPETLLGLLGDREVFLPLEITKRLRRFNWTTDLRYETGRRDTGETRGLLKTAKLICDWVEGQMA